MPSIALLDANVLWSAAVRDTLLTAAEHGLFYPAWTFAILEEMASSLKRARADLDPARIDRTVALMLEHFPDALVAGYEALIPTMQNHPGDRHVLAAAVHVQADALVTWNVGHFPVSVCEPFGIDVYTPDEFLCELWSRQPEALARVLHEQAAALANPPTSTLQLLETLRRSMPRFADIALGSGSF